MKGTFHREGGGVVSMFWGLECGVVNPVTIQKDRTSRKQNDQE